MERTSSRVQNLSLSQTLAMAQKSRELTAQGHEIINLSIGEPDFNTPEHVKEAAIKAIEDNFTHYTPVPGFMDLREAIVAKLKRDNHLEYEPNQIIVSNGAKQSIANVFLAIVNKGDEVIIPAPYWVTYPELVKIAEGKPRFIHTDLKADFKITPEQLEKAITKKTKAFIFSSPSNPTGSVYSYEELKALAGVFEKHKDIIIISDEIYELINFEGPHYSLAQFDELKDQVVVINGVSKGYAMTGWRIGYMAGPLWLSNACNKIQGQYTSGASSIAQKASVAALTGDQSSTKEMCTEFQKRRDLMLEGLKRIPGIRSNVPHGAFYLFPEVKEWYGKTIKGHKINNASELCLYLLMHANVATVTGDAFGNPDCIRISYAASEKELKKALDQILEALS